MARGPVLHVGSIAYPLYRPVTTIGRRAHGWDGAAGPDVDLAQADHRHVVSRRHAVLQCDGKAVYLRDVGSTNGTLVNEDVLLNASMYRLQDGDHLSFGGVKANFEANGEWPDSMAPLSQPRDGQASAEPAPDDTLPGPRSPRPQTLYGYPGQPPRG
jgi:pSer/pThr/pTyr-binding forkhead associated (FHA) protein